MASEYTTGDHRAHFNRCIPWLPTISAQIFLLRHQVGYRHIDCSPQYGNQKEVHGPVRAKKGTKLSVENYLKPDIPATWQAMEKLYDSGKARAIGVSNFSCKKLEDLLNVARVPPAVNQVECHPVWQQGKLRKLCQSKGVHLSAYAPLGSPGSPGNDGPNVLSHPTVISIAKKLQKSPAQVALRWGIQMGQSVLPKSDNEVWTRENIDIFDWCIPEELMAKFYEIQQAWLHILTNYLLKA
ncbi:Os05g0456200 [Oryza sativa Japonica Group]|uniref:Os05g0456200 protein n=1 Tax=Oryza sativa subsp. japonica TaxID=39947 RepID=Q0DHN0_ORYSJ|nr:Os05g0456200 [Oryza sativa Japonica Group]|eukprot:NP_001055729.2 Os05g0456200 [Oryza sativa Japonica Group]